MKPFFPVAVLAFAAGAAAQIEVDGRFPDYKPTSGVSGSIQSVGSDTMNNLMTAWAEGFRRLYPNVRAGIEGKGSTTARPRSSRTRPSSGR